MILIYICRRPLLMQICLNDDSKEAVVVILSARHAQEHTIRLWVNYWEMGGSLVPHSMGSDCARARARVCVRVRAFPCLLVC